MRFTPATFGYLVAAAVYTLCYFVVKANFTPADIDKAFPFFQNALTVILASGLYWGFSWFICDWHGEELAIFE